MRWCAQRGRGITMLFRTCCLIRLCALSTLVNTRVNDDSSFCID